MTTWPAETSCPPDVSDFVNFCIAANERMKGFGSVMVTCWCVKLIVGVNVVFQFLFQ
jgi:hypothetical protein